MGSSIKTVFGGLLACLLLLLYAAAMVYLIWAVYNPVRAIDPKQGFIVVVTAIHGLVSALVVASLAIPKPGDPPIIIWIAKESNGALNKWVMGITWSYLVIWLLTGLAALIVGVMLRPEASSTLHDLGSSWIGLALAASFVYLGIKPQG